MTTYRYSRWDGSQRVFDPDEGSVMDALSDDILAHGDVSRALRSLFQRGFHDRDGQRIQGLRELVDRLKKRRQLLLERYNLDAMMDDLKERVRDVIETERRGIDARLQEASQQLQRARDEADHLQGPMRLLEDRAHRSQEKLDNLPESPGGAIKELSDYDFMDAEAREKFQELLHMPRQQMLRNHFQSMRQRLQDVSSGGMEGLKNMVEALNQMLRDRAMGKDPDFDGFMREYGHYFDPNRPTSLDELVQQLQREMAAMQSLVESMTPEMRRELESLMESAMDLELGEELAELAGLMYDMFPFDDLARQYPFMGEESLTLDQAMSLMAQLQDMDDLERQIQEVMRRGDIVDIDLDKVEQHLGQEARRHLERLQRILQQMEQAGFLKRRGERLELTPKGIRKLAQQALKEIFSQIKKERVGGHQVYRHGEDGEATSETKPYEFGDPFHIDLHRTLFNAVLREGPKVPVRLSPEDLEMRRTEHMSRAATVVLLDQSRSMGMFGNFTAAKKVALALYWLIHSSFPRDYFSVIGFSDYAMEVKGEELPEVTWNAWVSGTNMQHAFMLSRRLLSKRKVESKQILMITDGEPTAHLEDGHAYFSYPPSYRTIEETLKEVKRCTREGITINTFMLEASHHLVDFVDKITRVNRGRAFYTTPRHLGRYVMVDYLRGRRRGIG